MDVTNRFVLDYALRHPGRMLDYGCGGGELVAEGRARGLEIFGTDVFYGGSNARQEAADRGLLGDAILPMEPTGAIPFPDLSFDLVTNNQVMEHVANLDAVLHEIHRVLKPGGVVLSVFPSRDVWREGHIGIPFSHWFRPGSRFRFYYTWALRAAGLGTWKEQAPTPRQWAIDKLHWIDTYTVYRSRREIFGTYARYFESELREREYVRYRLLDRPGWLRRFLVHAVAAPGLSGMSEALFRKLAFLVIRSTKS